MSNENLNKLNPTLPTQADRVTLHDTISALPLHIIESILEGAATKSPKLVMIIQEVADAVKESQLAHQENPEIDQGDKLVSASGETSAGISNTSAIPRKRKFGDEDGKGQDEIALSQAPAIRAGWMNKFNLARCKAHGLIAGRKSLAKTERGLVRIIVEVFECSDDIINRVIDETGVWGSDMHELKRTAASVLMQIMDMIYRSHPSAKVVGVQKGEVPMMLLVATRNVLKKMGRRERELVREYYEMTEWQNLVEELLESDEEKWAPGFRLEVGELMDELYLG